MPGMVKVGVPQSWLTFPIGVAKTAGAIGLLLGFLGVPLIGVAAACGLVLFFVCAVYTHLLARDYTPQFGLANGFLLLSAAALVLGLARLITAGSLAEGRMTSRVTASLRPPSPVVSSITLESIETSPDG